MVDPLTVSTILALAFQFANSEAGKAAIAKVSEVTTASILDNIGKLRDLIWQKLQGDPDVENALKTAEEKGETEPLKLAEPYLQIAMKKDPAFAEAVQQLAQTINISLQVEDNSTMTQNNYGGTNFQTKVTGGEVIQANSVTINKYDKPPH
jgi:hypothetical protein